MAESSGTGKWIVIIIVAVVAALALFMAMQKTDSGKDMPEKVDVKIEAPATDAAPAN